MKSALGGLLLMILASPLIAGPDVPCERHPTTANRVQASKWEERAHLRLAGPRDRPGIPGTASALPGAGRRLVWFRRLPGPDVGRLLSDKSLCKPHAVLDSCSVCSVGRIASAAMR